MTRKKQGTGLEQSGLLKIVKKFLIKSFTMIRIRLRYRQEISEGDENMSQKIALVTGGTSGIGLGTCRALKRRGCKVYEISRRETGTDPAIEHLQADITKEDQVQKAVQEVYRREGRIDILINNAGYGISGAIEFTPTEEAKKQFDVNFFGMVNVNRAVLPIMRRQHSGRILNLSSVAGQIAIPFQAYYSASKAAVLIYTMALANEVRCFGIHVTAIMPGDIHTGFTAARRKNVEGDDVYEGRITRSVAVMEHDELTGIEPEDAGEFIAKKAFTAFPAPAYTLGSTYALLLTLTRFLSRRVVNYVVGKLYIR